jgi:hypothetical protein
MHRFLAILLLSSLAWAQATTPKPAVSLNDSENARKARAVIDRTIQVLGGQAFLAYQNRSEEGRYYPLFHGRTNSTGIPYNYYSEYPERDRFEVIHLRHVFLLYFSVSNIKIKDKSDIVLIHNGLKGYETTYKGTAAEDAKELADYLRRREHSLEWVCRKWINDPSVALFYDGVAVVDGKAADQVTLLNNQNDAVTLFLDQNSGLPLKTGYSWRDPQDKQRNTEETIYDNYKPVQGIMTPHSITRLFNGDMSQQRFIDVAKYNLPLPDSMFEADVTYDPMQPPAKR